MPSTYSNSLKIQLMATGENNTTWGNVANVNLGTALEEAIVGSADVTFASDNQTLTLSDTNATQTARHLRLDCIGVTGGATRDLTVPSLEKAYIIRNSNADDIAVKTAAGASVTVPAGKTTWVYCDGTDVLDVVTFASSMTLGAPLPITSGGTGANTAADARTSLGIPAAGGLALQDANNVAITGGTITGITDITIADGGTGASTAAGARTNLGLGTLATQNANSVTITGGSLAGITDLAVTDGGTGASSAGDARTNLGLGTIATQNSNGVSITGGSVAGIVDLALADGGTGASTAADARTNLGLGTIATQNSNNVAITGGTISGITPLAVVDGGTGTNTASAGLAALGGLGVTASSLSGTGYVTLSNGLKVNWGAYTHTANSYLTVTFTSAFTTCYSVVTSGASEPGNTTAQDNGSAPNTISAASFSAWNAGTTRTYWYIAIGV
jgi:hypothetical protein